MTCGDRCWRFFIEGKNIEEAHQRILDGFMNELDVLIDSIGVVEMLPVVQSLSGDQRDLLVRMLQIDPANRIVT